MSKCKWENDEFKYCPQGQSELDFVHGELCLYLLDNHAHKVNFCPFCGADVRKPEQVKQIEPESTPEQNLINGIIEGGKPWNDHLLFSVKEGVIYLLKKSGGII